MRSSARRPGVGTPGRVRVAAWALAGALAGLTAFALALLAERGFALCGRRLVAAPAAMPAMAMPGAMPPVHHHVAGWCPIVVAAAAVAAALALIAAGVLIATRVPAGRALDVLRNVVARTGTPRVAAVLAALGGAPLAGLMFADPAVSLDGPAAAVACGLLALGALAAARVLVALAAGAIALGRRAAGALLAAYRRAAPPPVVYCGFAVRPVPAAGIRLARRRPARAPPPAG